MANLKEIRSRIASVTANMKITQAMKLVSASKFKRAADAVTSMRPYAEKMSEILSRLSSSDYQSPYSEKREVKKVLLIVFSSNKGLCGAFNSNIIKLTKTYAQEQCKGRELELLTIGTRGAETLRKVLNVSRDESRLLEKPDYGNTSVLAEKLMADFENKAYDEVVLIYNRFKNAATQVPTAEVFLPLTENTGTAVAEKEYIFEPSQRAILEELIPQSLKLTFYRTLRDSIASEHGARMTAMSQATDNAAKLKAELSLQYNKERQWAITSQLIEIIGSSEALGR